MDELVRRALQRWPDVPACTGWLALDARGNWWIREAATHPWPRSVSGVLDKAGASRIQHEKLLAFIQRNYAQDDDGYWFFQNGPQCVYVDLEAAPFVLRLQPPGQGAPTSSWMTHTGLACEPDKAYVDEAGRLFLGTSLGAGIVHTLDMSLLVEWVDESLQTLSVPGSRRMQLQSVARCDLEQLLGFRAEPSAEDANLSGRQIARRA